MLKWVGLFKNLYSHMKKSTLQLDMILEIHLVQLSSFIIKETKAYFSSKELKSGIDVTNTWLICLFSPQCSQEARLRWPSALSLQSQCCAVVVTQRSWPNTLDTPKVQIVSKRTMIQNPRPAPSRLVVCGLKPGFIIPSCKRHLWAHSHFVQLC